MKKTTKPQLAARRREVANAAHPNLAERGWTLAAIADHWKILQGTVSRDLAATREFWLRLTVYAIEKVPFGYFDAHNRLL